MSNEHNFQEGPLTLALDTATERRGVALLSGARLLAGRESGLRESGASSVLAEIDEVLKEAGVAVREVELFACAAGPGSFTGLRAGLATLKALALTLGRPAVGVPTLHAVAYAARPAERLAALIPAGRGEVFAQFLSVDEVGEVRELSPPAHLAPARLFERADGFGGGLKWAGGGSLKYAEAIREAARARGFDLTEGGAAASPGAWALADGAGGLAREVALLAQARWRRGEAAGANELRALYVRPSDAELHEQCQKPG
jgi:tRNA threonylcarbamoyladenosine biosynthesis protein TsaB